MWFKLASATFNTHLGSMASLSNSWGVIWSVSGGIVQTNCPSSVTKGGTLNATLTLNSGASLTSITSSSGTLTKTVSGTTVTVTVTGISKNCTITVVATGASSGDSTKGNGALGLPVEYQAVEYIETSGTQYFVFDNTKISANVNYEIRFSAAKVTGNITALAGSYSTTAEAARSQLRLSAQKDNSNVEHYGLEWMYGAQGSVAKADVADTQIAATYWSGINTVKVDANKLYFNDTLIKTYNTETFTTSQTDFTLFAQNNNNAATSAPGFGRMSSVKCYYVKINDTTKGINKELIPCYRVSDNAIGFYDKVSSTFILPTAGTITLKGSIVAA